MKLGFYPAYHLLRGDVMCLGTVLDCVGQGDAVELTVQTDGDTVSLTVPRHERVEVTGVNTALRY